MSEHQIQTLIGFARRAGKLAIGRTAVNKELYKNKVSLLLIANDASDKLFKQYLPYKGVRTYKFMDKHSMAEMLGRDELAVIAVCDAQLARSIQQLLPPEACITYR